MSAVLTLVKKDFLRIRVNRVALLLLFIVPLALTVLLGQVYGVNRRDPGPVGIPLALINLSTDPAALRVVAALQAESAFRVIEGAMNTEQARAKIRDNEFRFALIIPPDLTQPDRVGLHLIFLSNPRNSIEASTVYGILQKVIYTTAPQLLLQAATVPDAPSALSRLVKIDTEQVVGRELKSPMATLVIGGWAMQFLLFALSNSAAAIYTERDLGLYQRLLSAPVTRAQIIWSKFYYGVLLGVIQLLVLFLAGSALYGVDVVHHLAPLLLICSLAAANCIAFGLLIAAIMPTAEASSGTATLVILLMSAISGAWFPVSFMPQFVQHISAFTPVYWAMRGFEQVLWSHDSWAQLLPTLGVLTAIGTAVMTIASWRLGRSSVFQ
jgi:ABC-type multidrug transport system permease subunit